MKSFVAFTFGLLVSTAGAGTELRVVTDVDYSILQVPVELTWGADPFEKTPGFILTDPTTSGANPASLKLEAIIYDPKEPMAIINGQTVGLGDDVSGRKVSAIAATYVILEQQGSRYELTLPPSKVKGGKKNDDSEESGK